MDSEFVTVAKVSDLPPLGGLEVVLQGRRIAIFKTPTGLFAVDAECPHKGAPLALGWVENDKLFCPLHGWEFDLKTGFCQAERRSVACYPVKLSGDDIQIQA